jgi:hypothetical protein
MMQQPRLHIIWYVISDFITAALAWGCFYFLRKFFLQENTSFRHAAYAGGYLSIHL